MSSLFTFILFLIVFIPIALIQTCMPILTRRTESFGVAIPAEQFHNPTLKQMRKTYATWSLILAIVALVLMLLTRNWMSAFPILLLAYLVSSFFVYFYFHRKMKAFKAEQNWYIDKKQAVTVDTSFRSQKLTYSNGWFVIGLCLSVATIIFSFAVYDKIPSRIPMKFALDGTATRWADKNVRTLLYIPIIQLYLLGLFIFVNVMIGRAKAVIDPDTPEASAQRNAIFRRRWSAYMITMGTLLILMMGLTQVSMLFNVHPEVMGVLHIIFVVIVIMGTIILSFTTGQGGSRIKLPAKTNATLVNRNDDRYWKLGVFYFNKEDPALFVEKRFGIGWTNNFAHPLSWLIIIGFIVIIILIGWFLGD